MFRQIKVFLISLIAIFLLSACQEENDKEILLDKSDPRVFTKTDEVDLYEAGPNTATQTVSLSKIDTIYLNQILGFPENGNALKVHTACISEQANRVYAVGIMTPDVAVIENGKLIDYFHTDLPEQSKTIKYVFCEGDYLIVADEGHIISFNPASGEKIASIQVGQNIFPNKAYLDEIDGLFLVGVPEENTVDVYNAKTLNKVITLDAGRGIWARTKEGELLSVTEKTEHGEILLATWYDPKDFTVLKEKEISNFSSSSFAYDPEENSLWVAKNGLVQKVPFDLDGGKPMKISFPAPEDVMQILVVNEKVLVVSENGYDENIDPGFKGGLIIANSLTGEIEQTLLIPWKHSEVDATSSGTAVLVNNDGNSVDLINLNTGEYQVVRVGSSAETVAVDNEGHIYVGNRLGGSTVPVISSSFDLLEEITTEAWPVNIFYSPSLNQIFTYNMLGSSISVIDPTTLRIERTYDLGVPDANTDALGEMVYDETHHVFFVAIPEQMGIIVVDAENGDIIKKIQLSKELTKGKELGGPGTILLGVYEPKMTLFAYVKETKQLIVFDGLNDFQLVEQREVEAEDLNIYPNSLFVDQYHDRLFLANTILNANSLENIGFLPTGVQQVLGIDNEHGVLFAVGSEKDKETLYALNADLSEVLDSVPLTENQYVKTRGIFDASSGLIYAAEMGLAQVLVFDPY